MAPWAATAFVYATQLLAGWLAVRGLYRAAPLPARRLLPRALLAGPALMAVQMCLLHAGGVAFTAWTLFAPWWLAAAGLALLRARQRAAGLAAPRAAGLPAPAGAAERGGVWLAAALFLLALGMGLAVPVHKGDPLNNFTLPARVYAEHGSLAPEALAGLVLPGHIQHPPTVALSQAQVWMVAPDVAFRAVKPIFALALLAWLLLLAEVCWTGGLAARVALAAFVLLACQPGPPQAAAQGMADLRLAACLLALILAGRELLARPVAATAWRYAAWAAVCAFTKNEGLALGLGAALLLPWLALRGRLRPAWGWLPAAAVLLGASAWPAWLAAHGLRDEFLSHAAREGLPGDLAALPGILGRLAGQALFGAPEGGPSLAAFLAHGVAWPAALLLTLAACRRRSGARRVLPWCALLAAHLGLYALVLLPSPEPRWWVLMTAPRMVLHATPWIALLLVAALGERVVSGTEPATVLPGPPRDPGA